MVFDNCSTAMQVAAAADLHGKLALVTGATSGIGLETARALAAAGADLILAVRRPEAGETLATGIRSEFGRRVLVVSVDLAEFGSVSRAAELIADRMPALDILVANAGVSKTPESHQADGIDVRFACNHLGHFLLSWKLRRQMAVRGARIVVVSSAAHKQRRVHLDDLAWRSRSHDIFRAYGESKTANILFAMEATNRWSRDGIFANAVLPGTILTGLQRFHDPEQMRSIGFIQADGQVNPAVRSTEQGAATTVWAATVPELTGRGGLVLENCAVALPAGPDTHPWQGFNPAVADPETAARLWEASLEMLAPCVG
ncbi:MAG: SDR family NAD(P)-dependent oxidoreductase [Gammaproteobacteria bacterium]